MGNNLLKDDERHSKRPSTTLTKCKFTMSDMPFECEISFNMAGVTFPQKSNKILIVSTYGSELGLWFAATCSKYSVQS